jgi:Raf kinase inhibitor-like YbhB/YbcL family protein
MELKSLAFKSEGVIPRQYTCDGSDVSPPLNWENPPDGTQSFALMVDDPDAPRHTFVHWVIYNLPAESRYLPEHIPAQAHLPNGSIQGKNDFGRLGYGGPCPLRGMHRYCFKLYAIDTLLDLAPGATKAQLLASMKEHILASSEMIGCYSRNA